MKFLPKTRPVPRQEGRWPETEPGRVARQPARDLPVSRARESREGRGASRAEGGRRTRHEVQRAIPSRTLCVEGSGGRRGGRPRRGHGARWGPASEAAGRSPSGRAWAPAGSAPERVGKRASGAPRGWRWFWAGSALARGGAAWRLRGAARRRGLPSVRRCPRGPRPRPSVRLCGGSRSASARARPPAKAQTRVRRRRRASHAGDSTVWKAAGRTQARGTRAVLPATRPLSLRSLPCSGTAWACAALQPLLRGGSSCLLF